VFWFWPFPSFNEHFFSFSSQPYGVLAKFRYFHLFSLLLFFLFPLPGSSSGTTSFSFQIVPTRISVLPVKMRRLDGRRNFLPLGNTDPLSSSLERRLRSRNSATLSDLFLLPYCLPTYVFLPLSVPFPTRRPPIGWEEKARAQNDDSLFPTLGFCL